ncbi:tethering complex subunit, partial [Spiromyces aspiralis]
MADAGATNALVTDPIEQTYWVYNPFALYEVGIADEDRDVWRIYLQRNQFDLATKYAHDSAERDLVLRAQANYCFSNKQYNQSADYFAQSTMSFEETVLKFVQIHNNEALQRYLEAKLETLSNKERMQISLIATWLVEINLVILNSLDNSIMTAKLEEGKDHLVRNYEAEREVAEDSFKEFLGKYR